jgi:uncharacterized membrane protein YeaQ/YmgE (transglycosylase-associated protein family)
VIGFLIYLAVAGLIVGGLGRLAVPGPNPMGIGQTILVGIAGSFVGGLIGNVLFHRAGGLILSVLATAGIVYFLQRRN